MSKVIKIVSGGQTGVDRAALDVGIELEIPHGGWCPKGRLAEDGKIPKKYRLRETRSSIYLERTEKNVLDSDATAVFTFGKPEGGSLSTIAFAKKHKKPYKHFDLLKGEEKTVSLLKSWLDSLKEEKIVLNIAGSRESNAPGIYTIVKKILISCFQRERLVEKHSRGKFFR